MKSKLRNLLSNQEGAASIYTSMIIMVILMLAALSFATIMSRNYQQTTENQLNAQAFYAAETGIGDARARLLGLLESYGRGIRGNLPTELKDIDDTDLRTLLDGLSSTGVGRALIWESNNRLVVSTESGDVHILNRGASPPWSSITLSQPANATTKFGSSLAVANGCLYVGDPGVDNNRGQVFAYRVIGTNWQFQALSGTNGQGISQGDEYGASLAISAGGGKLIVGAPGQQVSGNANAGQVGTLIHSTNCQVSNGPTVSPAVTPPSDYGANSRFGTAVAFSGTDDVAVSGPGMFAGDGGVFFYDISGSSPIQGAQIRGNAGSSMGQALVYQYDKLVVGASASGKVYVYEDVAGAWSLQNELGSGGSDEFGASLSLSGNFLAVGAPSGGSANDGAAYVYHYKDNSWDNEIAERTGKSAGDKLGSSVAILNRQLAIGSPGANKEDGVQLFRVTSLGDLSFDELSNLLGTDCINKEDPDSDVYDFDLLEEEEGIYYSCLSINMAPHLLYYDEIERDRSLGILLKGISQTTTDYQDLESIVIQWVNTDTQTTDFDTSSDHPDLPPFGAWNYSAPILEVQITPLNRTVGYGRNDLSALAKTVYLYPSIDNPSETDWGGVSSGDIIKGHCDKYTDEAGNLQTNTGLCTVVLTDLMQALGTHYPSYNHPQSSSDEVTFHMRVRSLHESAHLTVKGYNYIYSGAVNSNNWRAGLDTLANRRARFRDVQAIVGSTGHAGNVQVRLEERFRLQPLYDYPEHGVLSSQTVCKILISDQDTGTDVTGSTLAAPPAGLANLTQECAVF